MSGCDKVALSLFHIKMLQFSKYLANIGISLPAIFFARNMEKTAQWIVFKAQSKNINSQWLLLQNVPEYFGQHFYSPVHAILINERAGFL